LIARRALAALVALLVAPALAHADRTTLIARFGGPDAALAERLTRATHDVVVAAGRPAVIQGTTEDILALAGCPASDPACLAGTPAMLDVERVVLGEVRATPTGAEVRLTVVGGGDPRHEPIVLEGADHDALVDGFRPAVARVLGLPPPVPTPAVAAAATVDAPTTTSAGPAPGVRPWAWAVLGGGVAIAGAGVVLLALAHQTQGEVDDAPTDTATELDVLADLEATGRSRTRWGRISLAIGGAAIAVGAILVIRQAREGTPAIQAGPSVGPDGAGVWLRFGGPP
jgi:hypothetical protein